MTSANDETNGFPFKELSNSGSESLTNSKFGNSVFYFSIFHAAFMALGLGLSYMSCIAENESFGSRLLRETGACKNILRYAIICYIFGGVHAGMLA